jgi:hypothetical protein
VVNSSHVPDELLALPTLVVDVKVHMSLQPENYVHRHNQVVLFLVEVVTQVLFLLRLHVETYTVD